MRRYLLRSLRHQFRSGRTLFLLTVAGVALGVASVVAIQTLNQGSLKAFDGSVRAVSGQADLTVLGTTPSFDETILARVLADGDVAAAWPLCRVEVAVQGHEGLFLEVIGFDLFAPVQYPLTAAAGEETDPDRLLREALVLPGWAAVTPDLAQEHGWSLGDTVTVSSGSRLARLSIGALVDFRSIEPLAPSRLAVMDIAQAQGLLARRGRIHQIDVVLAPGSDPARAAARMAETLGPGIRILTPEQRHQDAVGLLAAFRLNLTALSLISVFVGLFLVLASVQASLVRRRREFGVLRSLGTTRRQVLGLVLAEAAGLGFLGVGLGIPLGYLVAVRNIETVSATLTSIYVLEGIESLALTWPIVAAGCVVGLGGAAGGAILPAVDMARRDTGRLLSPLNLHEDTGRAAGRLAWLAVTMAGVATGWFLLAGKQLRIGGFVYGFVMMVALPLVVPLIVRTVCRPLRPRGIGFALSLRNLVARIRTTSFAVAALAVTVSMLIGITLLIGSFRQTLEAWLDVTIRADVYVSSESWVRAGNEAFLDRELLDELNARPAVTAVEEQRRMRVRTSDGRFQVWLNGVAFAGMSASELGHRLPLMSGDPETVARLLTEHEGVLIGEPLARKSGLATGDTLRLAGPDGPVPLPVVGVAYDYTSEGGTAFVTMTTLARHLDGGPPNNAALFLADGIDPEVEVARLQQRYHSQPLVFRSNRTLRKEIMAIFDQTFAVTRTLQGMALLIAVFGVALTLLIQARERAGELALMRAIGATRRQIFALFLGEGTGLGVLGLGLGLGGGMGLAALLILVINRVWFGWTIQPAWPAMALLKQSLVILAAAAGASVYPAMRAGLTSAGQLSRDDL